MSIKNSEKKVQDILDILSEDLRTNIEILGNVLIQLGSQYLKGPIPTPETTIDYLLEYKQRHGETIEGALIQQGLIMLIWLQGKTNG